jgi:hypothetical protein
MSNEELKVACNEIFLNNFKISKEESEYLEEVSHLQSKTPLLFKHRAGRITASLFHRVSQTFIHKPSGSLIKTLMQESTFDSIKVPVLRWGLINEDIARFKLYEVC